MKEENIEISIYDLNSLETRQSMLCRSVWRLLHVFVFFWGQTMFRPSWIVLHIFVFVLCIFWRPTMFRPVWRLPLQGGYIHAWGDKYTYAHSLWWEYIICSYFVSDPPLNIIQIFTITYDVRYLPNIIRFLPKMFQTQVSDLPLNIHPCQALSISHALYVR